MMTDTSGGSGNENYFIFEISGGGVHGLVKNHYILPNVCFFSEKLNSKSDCNQTINNTQIVTSHLG